MEIFVRMFLLLLMVLFGVRVGAAQENTLQEHPLLTLLSFVPPSGALEQGGFLSYIDYGVIFSANGGTPLDGSMTMAEVDAIRDTEVWRSNLLRTAVGSSEIPRAFRLDTDLYTTALGFAAWDIDRLMTFGLPPSTATIVMGDFNFDSVRTALASRAYVEAQIVDIKAMCWSEGCDQGQQIDREAMNPSLPFGSNLGRRPPLAFPSANTIVTSTDLERVETMLNLHAGDGRSLRDDHQWVGLVETLTDERWGRLAQVLFISPLDMQGFDFGVPAEVSEQVESTGTLPFYEAAAIADYDAGDEVVHVVAAVYADTDLAQTAAEILGARINAFDTADLYETFNVTIDPPMVIEFDNGAVALVAARYGYPNPILDETGSPRQAGIIFALWLRALYSREFAPLILG